MMYEHVSYIRGRMGLLPGAWTGRSAVFPIGACAQRRPGYGARVPGLSRNTRDFWLPLAVAGLLTLWFRFSGADLDLTSPWFGEEGWTLGEQPPWSWLYHFGTYPALLVVLGAVAVLLAGFRMPRWAVWRHQALYLVLVMAAGPGLVTNALLKDHWGRPRPREVLPLGGSQPFEPILTIDPASGGKSFPCGHATMGFFFFAGYFILRARRPRTARACLAFALGYGVLIGWARVAQGGHFPSDVVWAATVVWLVAAVLARWLRVEEPGRVADFRPVGWGRLAVAGLLVPLALFGVLLATPLDRRESFGGGASWAGRAVDLRLRVPLGETLLRPGDTTLIEARSHGFGLPGGGLKATWKTSDTSAGGIKAEFKQRRSGLQTELAQTLVVTCPPSGCQPLRLEQESGSVRLRLDAAPPAGPAARRWRIALETGEVVIEPNALPWRLRVNGQLVHGDPNPADEIQLTLGTGASHRIAPPRAAGEPDS
jgi:lipid A 4'-phosphatase